MIIHTVNSYFLVDTNINASLFATNASKTMDKTELGESGIEPEKINGVHDCNTVAETIDYLHWVFSDDKEYADEINIFFGVFRGMCKNYDVNIPSKDAASLLRKTFDIFESIRSDSSWTRSSIAHTAKHLAQSVDNRISE